MTNREAVPGYPKIRSGSDNPLPLKRERTNQPRRPRFGMATPSASSVPGDNFPVGNGGRRRFRRERGSPSALRRRLSAALVLLCTPKSTSVSRRNFFSPHSPPATTYKPGLKTHISPSHHPEPRPSRRRSPSSTKSLFYSQSIAYDKLAWKNHAV